MCAPEPYRCTCGWCEELRATAREAQVAFIETDDVTIEDPAFD